VGVKGGCVGASVSTAVEARVVFDDYTGLDLPSNAVS
jgi:hypothetical protein